MTAPDPSIELMRLINGYQVSQALNVAATLGVADQLKDGPKSYVAVAHACGAHPTSLYRLLRALAAVGVFHESDNKDYDISDYLHINPDFGTMQDFRRFMQEARRKSCG
jgi:hypothetical protein